MKLHRLIFGLFCLPSTVVSFQPNPQLARISFQKAVQPLINSDILPRRQTSNPIISIMATAEDSSSNNNSEQQPSVWTNHPALAKIGSTTSAVVAGTFYIVLAYQRDALMVSFFIGSIANGILSKVLKKLLKQERPAELNAAELELAPSDNGMPSSHAMSLGFIGTFTALQLPWTAPILLVYVIISLIYRVQTNLHTVEQILVGVTVGSMNGYLWRTLCLGTNPLDINFVNWVSANFLNEQGLLPWYGLAIPALVGAAVVGSVERRISRFLKNRSEKDD
jgi:membrane-associated phospholipid phosphatase